MRRFLSKYWSRLFLQVVIPVIVLTSFIILDHETRENRKLIKKSQDLIKEDIHLHSKPSTTQTTAPTTGPATATAPTTDSFEWPDDF